MHIKKVPSDKSILKNCNGIINKLSKKKKMVSKKSDFFPSIFPLTQKKKNELVYWFKNIFKKCSKI